MSCKVCVLVKENYQSYLAIARSQGKLASAVASSGIAATLRAGGRTAHSTFKLPLTVSLQKDSVCSIRKNGPLGKVLQDVNWDECTMVHRDHVEAVDRTLRDIRSSEKIMDGDYRHVCWGLSTNYTSNSKGN